MFTAIKNFLAKIWALARKGSTALISPLPFSRLTKRQWLYLPRLLTNREKIIIGTLIILALVSFGALFGQLYIRMTVVKPAFGGTYREGLLKEPRFINPIFASSNDTDRDITEIVFSGLIRYTPTGEVEPDLAESIDIAEDGKSYKAKLRPGLIWHDGFPLTADDVVFTIKTIQNPELKSPWRQNWQGVTVEKLDELTVRFLLRQPYAPFIENLTIGIIPEHLWAKVLPDSAPLSDLNLKPIGSGPYEFKTFTRLPDGSVTSYTLTAFRRYHHGRSNIKEIVFTFYPGEAELLASYRKGEIDGTSLISPKNLAGLQKTAIKIYTLRIPRIVALFFNESRQSMFADKRIRLALNHAIDTAAIIREVLAEAAEIAPSPVPPSARGFNADLTLPEFNMEKAKLLLTEAGWKDTDENGLLYKSERVKGKKVTTPLKVEIATSDFQELVEVANAIKVMWRKVGIEAEVKIFSGANLETLIIRPRAYQVLLFGEIFGHDPDPFAFWHTSQIKDPGLNIALYSNRKADTLLEEARRITDQATREEKYREFQKIVVEDQAAIFLFSPASYYGVRSSVEGVTIERIVLPHERFAHIEKWFMKTRRGLK